jgi:thioredoxin 1
MTNNDKVPELSNVEFEEFTKDNIVLIDFSADWCMPCLMMEPVMDELSDKFKGKIKFGKVDVSDNQELAQEKLLINLLVPCLSRILKKN